MLQDDYQRTISLSSLVFEHLPSSQVSTERSLLSLTCCRSDTLCSNTTHLSGLWPLTNSSQGYLECSSSNFLLANHQFSTLHSTSQISMNMKTLLASVILTWILRLECWNMDENSQILQLRESLWESCDFCNIINTDRILWLYFASAKFKNDIFSLF